MKGPDEGARVAAADVSEAGFLGLIGEATPNLRAYLARCEERPAWKRAVA